LKDKKEKKKKKIGVKTVDDRITSPWAKNIKIKNWINSLS
jgi:hypothetical protein